MAWMDPYTGPFTRTEAAHLARRTMFGPRPSEIDDLQALGLAGAVSSLLDYAAQDAAYDGLVASLPNDNSDLGRLKTPKDLNALIGSWMYRLVHSTQPLQEQLTIFLHDTLVSEFSKVATGVSNAPNFGNDGSGPGQRCTTGTLAPDTTRQSQITSRLLAEQVELYRTEGHLSYSALIKATTRDPAMLLYLDNATNTRAKPQENYGREVMELFTMGVGNYTETDVKEASKAFTGEMMNRNCAEDFPFTYLYAAGVHDTGTKTLLGTAFNLGAGDTDKAIDIIFQKVTNSAVSAAHGRLPATALHMSWKLLTWFVSETIPITHAAVEELAAVFNAVSTNGYAHDVREALRVVLTSQLFFDASFYYNMYKNPMEFVAGGLRALELEETGYATFLARVMFGMGMAPYRAPNVAGWDHGRSWINSGSLIFRFNYADRLAGSTRMTDAAADKLLTLGVTGFGDDAGIIEYFRSRLIHDALRQEELDSFSAFLAGIDAGVPSQSKFRRKVRGMVHLTLTLPRYQLK